MNEGERTASTKALARSKWREKIAGERKGREVGLEPGLLSLTEVPNTCGITGGRPKYIAGEEKRKYLARESRKMGFYCAHNQRNARLENNSPVPRPVIRHPLFVS